MREYSAKNKCVVRTDLNHVTKLDIHTIYSVDQLEITNPHQCPSAGGAILNHWRSVILVFNIGIAPALNYINHISVPLINTADWPECRGCERYVIFVLGPL